MSQEKALYEIAQALNRLTILKTIEMMAAEFREGGFDKPGSYSMAEEELRDAGFCHASICDVVDDAEDAIVGISATTNAKSRSIVGANE